MSKKNPGYYTPIPGMDPERIHQALAAINLENGGQGATAEEIAERSGVPLTKVLTEMKWGEKGNAGYTVVERLEQGGTVVFRHTERYDPDQLKRE